jgi:hypothetical protein
VIVDALDDVTQVLGVEETNRQLEKHSGNINDQVRALKISEQN